MVGMKYPMAGVEGGHDGSPNKLTLRFDTDPEYVPNIAAAAPHDAGEAFEYLYGGGAGYGDPLERDPQTVLDDVLDEYVSLEAAERDYGVVLTPDGRRLSESHEVRHAAEWWLRIGRGSIDHAPHRQANDPRGHSVSPPANPGSVTPPGIGSGRKLHPFPGRRRPRTRKGSALLPIAADRAHHPLLQCNRQEAYHLLNKRNLFEI